MKKKSKTNSVPKRVLKILSDLEIETLSNLEVKKLLFPKKDDDVHYIFHKFLKKFQNKGGQWTSRGYPLMDKVRKWAKQYPNDIQIVRCDDAVHASSDLVVIEHKCKNDYMGTTVVFIPQCTNEPPMEFFLYPENVKNLIAALRVVNSNSRKYKNKRNFN